MYAPVHGPGRLRGAARAAPGRAAVPVLALRLGGHAALRRHLVRGCGHGLAGAAGVAVAGDGARAVRGAVLGARTWAASTGSPSPELYLRWFQLGAYLPLFRTHASLRAGRREPWEFGAEVLEHARVALVERRRLLPYFMTLAQSGAAYRGALCAAACGGRRPRTGRCGTARTPFCWVTACWWRRCWIRARDRRAVQLPRGRWYDTATGQAYEGPGQVLVDAPLSRIPVLARAGAVIPVRGDGRRAGAGGVGARPGADRGRAGRAGRGRRLGASRRSSGTSPAGRGRRVVVEREGEDGVGEPSHPVRRARARRAR